MDTVFSSFQLNFLIPVFCSVATHAPINNTLKKIVSTVILSKFQILELVAIRRQREVLGGALIN